MSDRLPYVCIEIVEHCFNLGRGDLDSIIDYLRRYRKDIYSLCVSDNFYYLQIAIEIVLVGDYLLYGE